MSYDMYKNICELIFEVEGDDYAFSHVFLMLEWNLLVWSDNCLTMKVNHFQGYNDSLVLYFSKTKGNQSGDKSGDPWHVYLNHEESETLPCSCIGNVSSFTSRPYEWKFSSFPINNQYDRFIKIFHRFIHENKGKFDILGVENHSLGRVSFVSEGSNNSVLVWMHGLSPYVVYLHD